MAKICAGCGGMHGHCTCDPATGTDSLIPPKTVECWGCGDCEVCGARQIAVTDPQGVALDAFFAERRFQDEKHGPLYGGGSHTIGEWILLMEAELAEAKRALLKGGKGRDSVLSEIIQVGALALAAIEQHGTGEITKRSI